MEWELEGRARAAIRDIPDYPKKGVVFKDITPLLKNKALFSACIDELASRLSKTKADYVVGMESRGFIVGGALAYRMGIGFVPARKKGKLPYKKISRSYELEYGLETLEMHADAVEKKSRIIIVDDLLATGGTAKAAADLVRDLGGEVVGFAFLIELGFLKGREKLEGTQVVSLIRYE